MFFPIKEGEGSLKKLLLVFAAILVLLLGACSDSSKKMDEETKELNVTMDVKEVIKEGKITFKGMTNLPENTKLVITLSNDDNFKAQSKVIVGDSKFESEQFSNKGNSLQSGIYRVGVTMEIASVQPKSVQAIIGNDSENLKGELVIDGDSGKTIEFSKKIEIVGAEKINHEVLIKEFKEQILSYYNRINDEYDSQKNSFDPATWGAFARDFREETNKSRSQINQSALNQGEQMQIAPAFVDLQMLLTAYAADLQNRGDDKEIDRLKSQIEDSLK